MLCVCCGLCVVCSLSVFCECCVCCVCEMCVLCAVCECCVCCGFCALCVNVGRDRTDRFWIGSWNLVFLLIITAQTGHPLEQTKTYQKTLPLSSTSC